MIGWKIEFFDNTNGGEPSPAIGEVVDHAMVQGEIILIPVYHDKLIKMAMFSDCTAIKVVDNGRKSQE